MPEFMQSIIVPNVAVAADGDITYELPVNPLSLILLHLSPLNETSTITTYGLLEQLLSAVDNLRVTYRGAAVIQASGVDLAALAMLWHGFVLWQSNPVETDNDRRSLVLPVCFGKRPFNEKECFPASKRGELLLTVTWDIADTGFDGLRISIETVELYGAKPEYVEKKCTTAQTNPAIGQNDIELPIGNFLRAVLLWGTTPFAGATPAPSLGQLALMVNNRQVRFSGSDFEVLRGLLGLKGLAFPPGFRHIHSGTYTTTVAGDSREPEIGASLDDNYVMLDLDPLGDDSFGIDTADASRVNVRVTAETADAVRAIPIERVLASTFLEVA